MNKKIITWVVAAFGVVLLMSSIWVDAEKGPSAVRSFVIAAVCIVVFATLIRANVIRIPDKRHVPFISSGPVFPNLVKAGLCLILAALWGYFGAIFAKDTSSSLVAGAVLGPPVVLAVVGGWFVFKASGPG